MNFLYFTKSLKDQDTQGLIRFCKETGVNGLDLAVRPGYPVNPQNAVQELPKLVNALKGDNLEIGIVTAPTSLINPDSIEAKGIFEACGKAGVKRIKIGYFAYQGNFNEHLGKARSALEGFGKLAKSTGVQACYHTHSGNNLGNNAASLFLLLKDFDPHIVGAFADTGHLALNGGPIRMELEIIKPWFSILAIKDITWTQRGTQWDHKVVPAGKGIVRWQDAGKALVENQFRGSVVLHGEYETSGLPERIQLAKEEIKFLNSVFSKPS